MRLNRWREKQLSQERAITYGDLAREFVRLCQPQTVFERELSTYYIYFLSDFMRNKEGSRRQAIAQWHRLKKLKIPKTYQAWKRYQSSRKDNHFAIHPAPEGYEPHVGSMKLAFEVFEMDKFISKLSSHKVTPLYPPRQMGPMLITAVQDPDGNEVEFTQLQNGWYEHLSSRSAKDRDITVVAETRS